MSGITRGGVEAETRFGALTGARLSRQRSRGDCVLERHFVEVKTVGREGQINQIRPVKYIPLVVWDASSETWYVIPPHVLVQHACRRLRGQHSENPLECVALPLRLFRGYRVDAVQLRSATLGCIALSAAHMRVAATMRAILQQARRLAREHRIYAQEALDADGVVDLRGSLLLPW